MEDLFFQTCRASVRADRKRPHPFGLPGSHAAGRAGLFRCQAYTPELHVFRRQNRQLYLPIRGAAAVPAPRGRRLLETDYNKNLC